MTDKVIDILETFKDNESCFSYTEKDSART